MWTNYRSQLLRPKGAPSITCAVPTLSTSRSKTVNGSWRAMRTCSRRQSRLTDPANVTADVAGARALAALSCH